MVEKCNQAELYSENIKLHKGVEIMLKKRKLAAWGAVVCLLMLAMSSVTVFAAEETTEYVPKMYASFWALVPPVVAIVLALITKEVYSSLFVGIVIGGLFLSLIHILTLPTNREV